MRRERHGERQALALATAQAAPRGARARSQTHSVEERRWLLALAVEIAEQAHHIGHTGRRIHASVLKHDAHTLGKAALVGRRVEPEHSHVTTARRAEPLTHLDGRGLAGTIRAQHGGNRAGLGSERHPVDGHEISVTNPQVFDDNSRIGHDVDATARVPEPGK